jgi:hypothetical protein
MKSQNEEVTVEVQGIIVNARFKIERALAEREAYDEGSAADLETAQVHFVGILDLMEQGGLIGKTAGAGFL